MRYLVIRNYLEKVTDENLGTPDTPWYKVDKGNFRLASTARYADEKRTVRQLIKDSRKKHFFYAYVRNGFRTEYNTAYGIRSYQEVTIEESNEI